MEVKFKPGHILLQGASGRHSQLDVVFVFQNARQLVENSADIALDQKSELQVLLRAVRWM